MKHQREAMSTQLRGKRLQRGLSLRTVCAATRIPLASLQRMEIGTSDYPPKKHYARALYQFYEHEIDLADIYDPLFDNEVGGAE